MKLEDQVCSLELAKRLKELGVKQESLYFWWHHYSGDREVWSVQHDDENDTVNEKVSAFTVAELGEMLPDKHGLYSLEIMKTPACWIVRYGYSGDGYRCLGSCVSETEANARANMLVHLIEKGIVLP